MMSKRSLALAYLAVLGLLVFWWLVVTDWISRPHSYKGGVFYLGAACVSMGFHLRALYRFHKMTTLIGQEERAGIASPGSKIFAANQRFRYLMRAIEGCVVIAIGVFAILSVKYPSLEMNVNYIRLVLTFFVGSVLLTGFLTYRDLRVLNKVRKLAEHNKDEVTLQAIKDQAKRDEGTV